MFACIFRETRLCLSTAVKVLRSFGKRLLLFCKSLVRFRTYYVDVWISCFGTIHLSDALYKYLNSNLCNVLLYFLNSYLVRRIENLKGFTFKWSFFTKLYDKQISLKYIWLGVYTFIYFSIHVLVSRTTVGSTKQLFCDKFNWTITIYS